MTANLTEAGDEPNTPALAAYVYAARGWPVLPLHGVREVDGALGCTCVAGAACQAPGAHPLDGLTLADSSTSGNTIAGWWSDHPRANVGIVGGGNSGFAVVTVDDDLLAPQHQPLALTMLAAAGPIIRRTGRSTSEMLFASPTDDDDGTDIARGLDFAGGPALVCAPPSQLAIGTVEWAHAEPQLLTAMPMTYTQLVDAVTEIAVPWSPGRDAPVTTASALARAAALVTVVEPVLVRVSAIEPRVVEWLIRDRIPLGGLTMLAGHPGAGKSAIAADLVARVTTGAPAPITGEPMSEGSAIIMCCEDDAASTIRPRLAAARANLDRVYIFNEVTDPFAGERGVRIPHDVSVIERVCRAEGVRLIVIDPITDFLHRTDANSEQDVRRALVPLAQLAQRLNLAVVFLRHLTKREQANALHRGVGSVAFGAVARAGLLVDHRGASRVLRGTKSNLGPPAAPLGFRIVGAPGAHGTEVGRVEWLGVVEDPAPAEPTSAVDRAKAFIIEQLAKEPVPALAIVERGKVAGIGERNLREAKRLLGVKSRGKPSQWCAPAEGCNAATPDGTRSLAAPDTAEDEDA